jgi:hypothetical protein
MHVTTAQHVLAEASSPFGKLRLELARDIFISTCGQNGQLPDAGHGQLQLTLQLVSESWRQVVIGMPNLWNDLDLNLWGFESPTLDLLGMVNPVDVQRRGKYGVRSDLVRSGDGCNDEFVRDNFNRYNDACWTLGGCCHRC